MQKGARSSLRTTGRHPPTPAERSTTRALATYPGAYLAEEIRGSEGVQRDLQRQIKLLGTRVPAYGRLLRCILERISGPARDTAFHDRLESAWRGRSFEAYYSRPLLLLASIRADVLADGPAHPLWAAIGEGDSNPAAVTPEAVMDALSERRLGVWMSLRTRFVQTNEVSRAITWRLPAALAGASHGARPVTLVDVGASAGLNLIADRLDLSWVDQHRRPVPAARLVDAQVRLGIDRSPLDVADPREAAWLRACVWPGEDVRLSRLEAAIEAFRAALEPRPRLERANIASLRRILGELGEPQDGGLMIVYQSLVGGYLSPEERRDHETTMRSVIGSGPPGRILWAELEMHGEPDGRPEPARLRVYASPTDGAVEAFDLAYTGYHPERLVLDASAVDALSSIVGPT